MIDGKYYYFNSDGYMERGCVRGGYILKTDGNWNSSYPVGSWHKEILVGGMEVILDGIYITVGIKLMVNGITLAAMAIYLLTVILMDFGSEQMGFATKICIGVGCPIKNSI